MADQEQKTEEVSFLGGIVQEIVNSPLNLVLVAIITFLIYKIFKRDSPRPAPPREPELPKLRRDFTVAELKAYDGNQPDGRVLVAVNGTVYDVTRGKRFYGPGGPYAAFGGRDASRGLATFSVTASEVEYDDLSDLTPAEMDSVREWEMQFKEKYEVVGRLLKPGEQPKNYSDEDDEPTGSSDKSSDQDKSSDSKKSEKSEEWIDCDKHTRFFLNLSLLVSFFKSIIYQIFFIDSLHSWSMIFHLNIKFRPVSIDWPIFAWFTLKKKYFGF